MDDFKFQLTVEYDRFIRYKRNYTVYYASRECSETFVGKHKHTDHKNHKVISKKNP